MIQIIEQTEQEQKEEAKKCPGRNKEIHQFQDPWPPLLSFCACQEWQVIQHLLFNVIRCINIYGEISEFE